MKSISFASIIGLTTVASIYYSLQGDAFEYAIAVVAIGLASCLSIEYFDIKDKE